MAKYKQWSDASLLKALPNPSVDGSEIDIKTEEVTFMGVANQPDYATIFLTFYPDKSVIELKSLKLYLQQFRNKVISYERLTEVIYTDLKNVYDPERLRVVLKLRPRGGITSKHKIDSDWKIRGGKESFRDWVGQSDEW